MTDKKNNNNDEKEKDNTPATKPEPETLHKTDPQENMEGPVSSPIKKAGEAFDTEESKEEADRRKEENI